MTKKFKKTLVGVMAAAICIIGSMSSISASAIIVDDFTPGPDKYWNVRNIGGNMPASEDRQSRFYVYNSSYGHNGYCDSISSHDTQFSVVATCVSGHSIPSKVWNGVGQKSWSVSGPNTDVRYLVSANGYWTVSQGHIWRE